MLLGKAKCQVDYHMSDISHFRLHTPLISYFRLVGQQDIRTGFLRASKMPRSDALNVIQAALHLHHPLDGISNLCSSSKREISSGVRSPGINHVILSNTVVSREDAINFADILLVYELGRWRLTHLVVFKSQACWGCPG